MLVYYFSYVIYDKEFVMIIAKMHGVSGALCPDAVCFTGHHQVTRNVYVSVYCISSHICHLTFEKSYFMRPSLAKIIIIGFSQTYRIWLLKLAKGFVAGSKYNYL